MSELNYDIGPVLNYTLTGLIPDTQYTIDVRMEIRYKECSYYLEVQYSNSLTVSTSDEGIIIVYR